MGIYINGNKIGGGGASCKKYAVARGNYIVFTSGDPHAISYSRWSSSTEGIYFRITKSKLRTSSDTAFANLSEISNIDYSKFTFDDLRIKYMDQAATTIYEASNTNLFTIDFFEENNDGKLYVHLYLPKGDYTSQFPGSIYESGSNSTSFRICCFRGVFKYDNKYVCMVDLEPVDNSTNKDYTKDFEIYLGTINNVSTVSVSNAEYTFYLSTGESYEQEYLAEEITSGAVLNYGTQEEKFYICYGLFSEDKTTGNVIRDDYPTSPGYWCRCKVFASSGYNTMTPYTVSKDYTLKE